MLKYANVPFDELPGTLDMQLPSSVIDKPEDLAVLKRIAADKALKVPHSCGFYQSPMGLEMVYYQNDLMAGQDYFAQVILFLEADKSYDLLRGKKICNVICYSATILYPGFLEPVSFMGSNEQPREGLARWWAHHIDNEIMIPSIYGGHELDPKVEYINRHLIYDFAD